jgi:hypothetical protein
MRVSVFCGSNGHGKIHFLGFGNIIGEEIPGADASGYLSGKARACGGVVPKILLDCGDVVWGSEVWWMDYYAGTNFMKKMQTQDRLVMVTVSDMRRGLLRSVFS